MIPRIVIAGAGITGLSLAWFLKQRFGNHVDLHILEQSSRAGGWICTQETEGFLFEEGPRSCRTHGTGLNTLRLVEALGLQDEVIAGSPSAKYRFIYEQKALKTLPTGILSFLLSPLMRGMLPALWKEWRTEPLKQRDESIYEFISRRLSPEIAERLIDPMTSGIYAGDIRQLSIRACFPEMFRWEQEHGSLVKGMMVKKKHPELLSEFQQHMRRHSIFTFKNGMESLVKVLARKLSEHITFNCTLDTIQIEPDSLAIKANGNVLKVGHLYLTTPNNATAKIIQSCHPQLAAKINQGSSASVAAINLGWKQNVLNRQGYGYLIPTREREDLLGVVFDSSVFPQQNRYSQETRLTVMLGGSHRPDLVEASDDRLVECALKALFQHLGIKQNPDSLNIKRAHHAIPQYQVGHSDHLNSIEKELKKMSSSSIHLLGSSWHGVSVNDCIANAERLATHTEV